ncbi:hypothetical protein NMG60_11014120 [Bertholletia excelsa]
MDKLKLASSSFGERLKTGGAQMSRVVSSKMKEILQSPTPESKMVDDATSEHLEEPNWGMNLRICAMINSEEFSGSEIVKAIKRKLSGKSVASQRLSLDLLEACTSNCDKVFSEVSSEKVLDEMVRLIDDPRVDLENRRKALQLIRAWGQSEDLKYLPVFHQTYMNLQNRDITPSSMDSNLPPMQHSLGSYINQQPPPEIYPVPPELGLHTADHAFPAYSFGGQSIEEKKEILTVARNSLDILNSILNSGTEEKPIKEELTVSMYEKCKQALPDVQRVAESINDDEIMLFEALNLHDELQQIISKYEEMEAAVSSQGALLRNHTGAESNSSENTDGRDSNSPLQVGTHGETERADSREEEKEASSNETLKLDSSKKEGTELGSR